jgi:molybdenum cofactor guanylyltransferase
MVGTLKVSYIVLAGGKSSRLGRNKILERVGDKALLDRVLSSFSLINDEIILVTTENTELPPVKQYSGLKVIVDLFPNRGSLGAIYTGLVTSRFQYSVVVAGDMPFLNVDLLSYMISIAEGFDLVAYCTEDFPELLHAVYSKNCLVPMESLIRRNNLRIIGMLPFIRMRHLSMEEIERFDPQHLSLFNVNTEEDLKKGREMASRIDRMEINKGRRLGK